MCVARRHCQISSLATARDDQYIVTAGRTGVREREHSSGASSKRYQFDQYFVTGGCVVMEARANLSGVSSKRYQDDQLLTEHSTRRFELVRILILPLTSINFDSSLGHDFTRVPLEFQTIMTLNSESTREQTHIRDEFRNNLVTHHDSVTNTMKDTVATYSPGHPRITRLSFRVAIYAFCRASVFEPSSENVIGLACGLTPKMQSPVCAAFA
jgi:hypothetical protein